METPSIRWTLALAVSAIAVASVAAAAMLPVWQQDFSVDDFGWFDFDDDWYGLVTLNSSTATFEESPHPNPGIRATGPFSRFDGYRDVWPGSWAAEIDVYLDPAWAANTGFDYSVAANGSDDNHQRDYIFHVGVVDQAPFVAPTLLVNGSNNADFFTNSYKLLNDNGGNYYMVTTPGWYTLQHVFYEDENGFLDVDLNLLDDSGNLLWSATRQGLETGTDPDAIPGNVGGNRYSWFTHIDVSGGIEVDNHELFLTAGKDECKNGGWEDYGFQNQGQCIQFVLTGK